MLRPSLRGKRSSLFHTSFHTRGGKYRGAKDFPFERSTVLQRTKYIAATQNDGPRLLVRREALHMRLKGMVNQHICD